MTYELRNVTFIVICQEHRVIVSSYLNNFDEKLKYSVIQRIILSKNQFFRRSPIKLPANIAIHYDTLFIYQLSVRSIYVLFFVVFLIYLLSKFFFSSIYILY